ncbi:MAG TPA: rhodanese-like domain-containing protein, partial [Hyphomicrobium sp.]|nr:rhodanese-like domain-containing protein [Hyphomicrobium sp.]
MFIRKGSKVMPKADANPLVTADWVKDNLNNPKVRIFEVSVDPGVYAKAHIPGAFNLDWHV